MREPPWAEAPRQRRACGRDDWMHPLLLLNLLPIEERRIDDPRLRIVCRHAASASLDPRPHCSRPSRAVAAATTQGGTLARLGRRMIQRHVAPWWTRWRRRLRSAARGGAACRLPSVRGGARWRSAGLLAPTPHPLPSLFLRPSVPPFPPPPFLPLLLSHCPPYRLPLCHTIVLPRPHPITRGAAQAEKDLNDDFY